MSIGFWQILVVVALLVLLFGRGRISELMGDVAKGIRSFRTGLAEDDTKPPSDAERTIEHENGANSTPSQDKTKQP